jgi:hypothetical protein
MSLTAISRQRGKIFVCLILSWAYFCARADEPPAYLQANTAAQKHAANSVNADNISLKTAQLHGLPASTLTQYNAIVEIWSNPAKLVRPTRDPNIQAQPAKLPNEAGFAAQPGYMSAADYNAGDADLNVSSRNAYSLRSASDPRIAHTFTISDKFREISRRDFGNCR